MAVDYASTDGVKRQARLAFRLDLAIPECAVYIHLFRSGGPRPHTIQVWKVPADVAQRSEAKQAAAVAEASRRAPRTATRAMMHEFYQNTKGADIEG